MTNISDPSAYFQNLLDEMFALPFIRAEQIKQLEAKVLSGLQQVPADICGLITLMFAEVMSGNRAKAKNLAAKIWEIGGELPQFFELVYIENLLSLGLIDMAAILLKPRFERLRENAATFYSVMAKFAIMTGNLALLDRINELEPDDLLSDFSAIFKQAKCQTQFKDIQKLVLENTAEYLNAYEYNLYDDRGFAELEIEVYTGFDDLYCLKLQNELDKKIEAYWRSVGKERLYNLSVVVRNIRQHESWLD